MATRNSNIELLRLICIFAIVLLHLTFFNEGCSHAAVAGDLIQAICNCGVSTFVLISGYFGIKSNYKKLLNIRNVTSFYLIGILFVRYYVERRVTPFMVCSAVAPIIYKKYWFLTSYVILVLLSPWINKLIDSMGKKGHLVFILVLIAIFYIVPTIFKYTPVDSAGKGPANMMTIYIVGRYIGKYGLGKSRRSSFWLMLFWGNIGMILLCNWIQDISGLTQYYIACHVAPRLSNDNSVFILMASVCVLELFLKVNFQSQLLNQVAKSTFAVYVLEWFVRPFLCGFFNLQSIYGVRQAAMAVLVALCIMVVCLAIDQVRLATTSRLADKFASLEERLIGNVVNKIYLIMNRWMG